MLYESIKVFSAVGSFCTAETAADTDARMASGSENLGNILRIGQEAFERLKEIVSSSRCRTSPVCIRNDDEK